MSGATTGDLISGGTPRRPAPTQSPDRGSAARRSGHADRTPAATPRPAGRRVEYHPAIDGLRGAAVAAVLCFHAGFGWAVGGYLGVSTFFTLSGFLITSLLLTEREATGATDLHRFWSRRFRRLMPAAFACLIGVVVFGATVATSGQLDRLRAEVLAALAYVANWQLIVAGQSYADIFSSPSPVQHFWSLAVEEQFYVLFPLAMLGLFALARGSRRAVAVGLALAVAASLCATFLLQGGALDRIYYGTDTRAAELLIGGLLAVGLAGRPRLTGSARTVVEWAGLVALAATIGLWATVEFDASWLYRGGFAAFALVSATLIAAAVQQGGPVRLVLGWAPLRWLGLISYGVYLYHWPIYLWLTPQRTGLGQWPLFGLRLAFTLSAAIVSFLLLERPVRTGAILNGRQALVLAPLALAVVAVGVCAVTVPDPNADPTFTEAQARLESGDFGAPFVDANPAPDADLAAAGTPTIATYGDSTALRLGLGLGSWIQSTGLAEGADSVTEIGCGLIPAGRYRYDAEADAPRACARVQDEWNRSVDAGDPDVALVLVGPWEVADWYLPDDTTWRHLGDPTFDQFITDRIRSTVDTLSTKGAIVYWLTCPLIDLGREDGVPPARPSPVSDPARMQRFNELARHVAAERPEQMEVLDLAGYLAGLPAGELDPALRPDGVHLTWESAYQVSDDWLGPEILRRYATDRAR